MVFFNLNYSKWIHEISGIRALFLRPEALPWFGVGNSSTPKTQKAVSWVVFVAVLVSSRSCALKPLNPTWTYCLGESPERQEALRHLCTSDSMFCSRAGFPTCSWKNSSSGTEFFVFRHSVYVKQPQRWRKITLILKGGALQLCRWAFTQTCSQTSVWDFWVVQ